MKRSKLIFLGILALFFISCGGGGSDSPSLVEFTKVDLVDTTIQAFGGFGTKTLKLVNGNVVIHEFQNVDNINAGTIRIYNSSTGELINSLTGDDIEDRWGSEGLYALDNGNFLIVSSQDDVGGLVDAGSVILVDPNGSSLALISGDQNQDQIGSEGITVLSNGNFLIKSRFDDVGGLVDVGSVKLVNGSTGQVISTLSSDEVSDNFANAGAFALPQGRFLISSILDDRLGLIDCGSVQLVNGDTGSVIAEISGDQDYDQIGLGGISVLSNGNFVISSWRDDFGSVSNAGSVKLVDGATGSVIVSIEGDNDEDYFGNKPATSLFDQSGLNEIHFVIVAPYDDISSLADAGSVHVLDGVTGAILASFVGDHDSDFLGYNGILDKLSNSNDGKFAILSEFDGVGSNSNEGSIKLINKLTLSLEFTIQGTASDSGLGRGQALVLSNGNFVISNPNAGQGLLINIGVVDLYDGNDGAKISSFSGNQDNDNLGSHGVIGLSQGNFVISSSEDDASGIFNAGSVKLVNGTTGQLIKEFKGKKPEDQISIGGTFAFLNGDFAFISDLEDVGSLDSAGTIKFVDGSSGDVLFSDQGRSSLDYQEAQVIELSNSSFLFSTPKYDLNSNTNTGRALVYKK